MWKGKDGIYNRFVKRIFDIICASLAMIVFCWLYAILAILVKIKLGSPVIYHQDRPGMIDRKTGKEKIFRLCKFRSMTNETDADGNLLPDAQRLTKFGKFLRATSLDELPEAWNIFKGDMSVIGPRPWAVGYLKYFTSTEHQRHFVRPGLSGYAQVSGRTELGWQERIALDLEYVDKISLGFDIKTIFLTVKKVVKRSDVVMTAEDQGNFSDFRQEQWDKGIDPNEFYKSKIGANVNA